MQPPADALFTRLLAGAIVALLAFVWLRLLRLAARLGLFQAEEGPRPVWNGATVAASLMAYVVISLALGVVYHLVHARQPAGSSSEIAAADPLPERPEGAEPVRVPAVSAIPAADQLLMMSVINALVVVIVPPILRRTSGLTPGDLGLADRHTLARDARAGLLLCLVLLPLVYAVFHAALRVWPAQEHSAQRALRDQWSPEVAALVVLSAVILAPIAEELLFRGVLLGWLDTLAGRRSAGGRASGLVALLPNVVVSVLFAAIHWTEWPSPLALFVLSLGLGWLVERTGRLGGSIAAHMLFNGVSAAALILAGPGGRVEQAPAPASRPVPSTAPAAAGSPAASLTQDRALRRPHRIVTRGLTASRGDLGSARRPATGA